MSKTKGRKLSERESFDPNDPFDIMCEHFRTQVTTLALDALKITVYRDMTPQAQLESFVSGTMTGLVGVCFASIDTKGRDEIIKYLGACLPIARILADEIESNAGRAALKGEA